MNDDPEVIRAWLSAHGLPDAELLHVLPNQGLDGADRLTEAERRLLSGLLEVRRAVVPGYRSSPLDRPSAAQDRPDAAQPTGLFNTGSTGQRQWATVQPGARPQPPAGRHDPAPPSRRAGQPSGSRSGSDEPTA
jgi:hypothetical protein